MNPVINHAWNLSEGEALKLQTTLSDKVIIEDSFSNIRLVAGVDVAYEKFSDRLVAAVVILDSNTLEIIESVTSKDSVHFPYIPGLFSFRELPSLVKAFSKLKNQPDLIVCDGQGIAHPRRFGLACHLGVIFDVPTIGCGKSRLLGVHQEPGPKRGDSSPLIDNDECIGCALRTQIDIKPIYISTGHRISLTSACNWVLKLSPKYRLPETTRQADQLVKKELTFKQ